MNRKTSLETIQSFSQLLRRYHETDGKSQDGTLAWRLISENEELLALIRQTPQLNYDFSELFQSPHYKKDVVEVMKLLNQLENQ